MFKNARKRIYSSSGSPWIPVYTAQFDGKGNLELEQIGEDNIYDEIQSHKDSVDIDLIIKRFQMTGDVSVLERIQGQYGDFSDMPESPMDVLNMNLLAQQYFDSLPVSIKEEYGNNYAKFLLDYGSENQKNLFETVFGKQQKSDDLQAQATSSSDFVEGSVDDNE